LVSQAKQNSVVCTSAWHPEHSKWAFIQVSVSTICINRNIYTIFTLLHVSLIIFGHHQVTLYIHSTFFLLFPPPPQLANVYIWGKVMCVVYTVARTATI
jgi:hypothetical protein